MQLILRMAPDGERASSCSPLMMVRSPVSSSSSASSSSSPSTLLRVRSYSDTHHNQSWFSRRLSLRSSHSADQLDDESSSLSLQHDPSPVASVQSLGVGHVTLDGKVDRFRSKNKNRPPRSMWLASTSFKTNNNNESQDSKKISHSSSDRSLASSTAESSMTAETFVSPTVNAGPSPTALLLVATKESSRKPPEDSPVVDAPVETLVIPFKRSRSSFIRVADLGLNNTLLGSFQSNDTSKSSSSSDQDHPNFSYAATDPPPGVTLDPNERWIALDDGAGSHAPVAPFAIAALAQYGMELCLKQECIWTPDSKTMKVIKSVSRTSKTSWQTAWQHGQPIVHLPAIGSTEEKDVLLWSAGSFKGNGYGCDVPAVRVMGILNLSPRALTDWLIDSSRVQEYNKMSLGRTDVLVLQNNLDDAGPFGKSVTKIMKSHSRPPLLRKTMQFISLLHARALEEDHLAGGYLIVTRAVTPAAENDATTANNNSSGDTPTDLLHSEILTGVNLMLPVQDDPNRCLMLNISHIKSPMVPMMLAKRIGLSAAANFIQDLRIAATNVTAR